MVQHSPSRSSTRTVKGSIRSFVKNCSKKKVDAKWLDSLTDFGKEHLGEINEDTVIKCRNAFIRGWLNQGATYVGKLNSADVGFPTNGTDLRGDEILIEYHLFKTDCNSPMISKWRLGLCDMKL